VIDTSTRAAADARQGLVELSAQLAEEPMILIRDAALSIGAFPYVLYWAHSHSTHRR
jgi:hypothetical protein